jgi:prepilin peptidase CpaA
MNPLIGPAIVLAVVCAAAALDMRTGRIPNWLTVPVAVCGLTLWCVRGGAEGLLTGLQGMGIALALWVFSSLFGRVIGGGDVKLLAAVGAVQGPSFLLVALLWSILLGGVLALAVLLHRRALRHHMRGLWGWLGSALLLGKPSRLPQATETVTIPYAVPIAIGTLLALFVA